MVQLGEEPTAVHECLLRLLCRLVFSDGVHFSWDRVILIKLPGNAVGNPFAYSPVRNMYRAQFGRFFCMTALCLVAL